MHKTYDTVLIVPTYNQKEVTLKLLLLLSYQTRPVDILVVDNNSTDGTSAAIHRQYPHVKILQMEKNSGSSGAQYAGCKYAYKQGYLNFILSDNDAFPLDTTLISKLISELYVHKEYGAVIPYNMDAITKPRTDVKVDCSAFHFLTIRRDTLDKIGFPDPNYFIIGDDGDFSLRIVEGVGPIILKKDVLYTHPIIKLEGIFSNFTIYYQIRNNLILCKKIGFFSKKSNILLRFLSFSVIYPILAILNRLFFGLGLTSIPLVFSALADGFLSRGGIKKDLSRNTKIVKRLSKHELDILLQNKKVIYDIYPEIKNKTLNTKGAKIKNYDYRGKCAHLCLFFVVWISSLLGTDNQIFMNVKYPENRVILLPSIVYYYTKPNGDTDYYRISRR